MKVQMVVDSKETKLKGKSKRVYISTVNTHRLQWVVGYKYNIGANIPDGTTIYTSFDEAITKFNSYKGNLNKC